MSKDCNKTILIEYGNEEPCELKSTDCVIYEGAIAYLNIEENTELTEVIRKLVLSLADARDEINILKQQINS